MNNPLVMKFEHPRYLSKFSEYCDRFIQHSPHDASNEAFNKASWEYAIFTHAVISKNFFNALAHLENANSFLAILSQNASSRESAEKLAAFTQKVQRQYLEFLERKKAK